MKQTSPITADVIIKFPNFDTPSIGNLQLHKNVPVKNVNFDDEISSNNNGTNVCEELRRDSSRLCSEKGLVLPFYAPESQTARVFIAILYLLAFAYIFIGVSLLSGRVMMAVEVITSKLKVVQMIRDRYGKMRPVMRPYWSDVVKNLTLYVLGFSAPEILITLVEIAKHGFEKADLGPETIVGSRAYHLFIITAICIVSVPRNEAKRVRRLRVYMITSFWAAFAYLWIFLIISLSSREVIEIWEALLTFSFYPVVVVTAWLSERYNVFRRFKQTSSKPRRSRSAVSRRSTILRPSRSSNRSSMVSRGSRGLHSPKHRNLSPANSLPINPNNNIINQNIAMAQLQPGIMGFNASPSDQGGNNNNNNEAEMAQPNHALLTSNTEALVLKENAFFLNGSANVKDLKDVEEGAGEDEGEEGDDVDEEGTLSSPEAEQNAQRELLWLRLKALKDRFPGRSQIELETMAEMSYLRDMPKNQSYYRIMATRRFTGEGHVITREKIRSKLVKETKVVEKRRRLRAGEQRVFFCPSHYVVVECEPFVELKVIREGSLSRPIEVSYETYDGTASAGEDYIETKGKLVFQANETLQKICVPIIDDEEFEDDEYFSVRLTSANYIDETPLVITEEETGAGVTGATTIGATAAGSSGPTSGSDRKSSLSRRSTFRRRSNKVIEIGPQNEACVTILDDDHCGVFTFPGASIVVPDNLHYAEVKVVRMMGGHGRVVVPFELTPVNAIRDRDYREPFSYKIQFEHRDLEKTIKIGIIDRQRAGDDSIFTLKLLEPMLIDEPPPKRSEALPRLGEQSTIKVLITESDEIKDTLDRLQTVGDLGNLFRTTWRSQFYDAINLQPTSFVQQDDGAMIGEIRKPHLYEYLLHAITLPWKLIFAALPPTGILDGWVSFFSCIAVVGVISILIEDLAAHFGCVCGIDKPTTAITVVAIGTSLPDMFASRAAAVHEKTADAALAHISGSNAVNVYLGLGLAWTVASLHHRFVKGAVDYKPTCYPHHLAANVLLFFVFSLAGLGVLIFRRCSPLSGRAELGGPLRMRLITAGILVLLYICYIALTILVNENIIRLNLI